VNLYFVRHATASAKGTWLEEDGLRPLTRAGRRRFQIAAAALVNARALHPDVIITSPLVRARQTAELLSAALALDVPVIEDPRLGHEFETAALGEILAEHERVRSLAIVGHNPSFVNVLSEVTGATDLEIRKGAVALVNIPHPPTPAGTLTWLAPPQLFWPCD
jgi:phosphohistidine phosphatase